MSAPVEVDVNVTAGVPYFAVSSAATSSSINVVRRGATIIGWFFRETTGSTGAIVDIYDGNDSGGNLIGTITLSSGEGRSVVFPSVGIKANVGVYADVVSGTVQGGVWLRYS